LLTGGDKKMSIYENVAIVIPSLEPDEKLINLLKDLKLNNFKNIIIVNDGSKKEYDSIFSIAETEYKCHVLTHFVNWGKGRALKSAFNYILSEHPDCVAAVTVDSDGQHRIEDICSCCKAVLENQDALIMGCRDFIRTEGDIPFRSRFGNIVTHGVLNILCGIKVKDTQTGLRGFSRSIMEIFLSTNGERFEYEMNMLLDAKINNIRILEIPIKTIYIEENRSSHFNPLLDSARIYAIFGKFLISSFASFIVDILLFTLLIILLRNVDIFISYYIYIATIVARIISANINYKINKNKVFKNKQYGFTTLRNYCILFCVQLLISAGAVNILYSLTGFHETIIKICVDTVLFLLSFYLQREWVFKND